MKRTCWPSGLAALVLACTLQNPATAADQTTPARTQTLPAAQVASASAPPPPPGALCVPCLVENGKYPMPYIAAWYKADVPEWKAVSLRASHLPSAATYALVDPTQVPQGLEQLPAGVRTASVPFEGTRDPESLAALPVLVEFPQNVTQREQVTQLSLSWAQKNAAVWLLSDLPLEHLSAHLGKAMDASLDGHVRAMLRLTDRRVLPQLYEVLSVRQRSELFGLAQQWRYVDAQGAMKHLSVELTAVDGGLRTVGVSQPLALSMEQHLRMAPLFDLTTALQMLDLTVPAEMAQFVSERERDEFVTEQIKRARALGVDDDVSGLYAAVVLKHGAAVFDSPEAQIDLQEVRARRSTWVNFLLPRLGKEGLTEEAKQLFAGQNPVAELCAECVRNIGRYGFMYTEPWKEYAHLPWKPASTQIERLPAVATYALVDPTQMPEGLAGLPAGVRTARVSFDGVDDEESQTAQPVVVEFPEDGALREQVAQLTLAWAQKNAAIWLLSDVPLEQFAAHIGKAIDMSIGGSRILLRLTDPRALPNIFELFYPAQRSQLFGLAKQWRYLDVQGSMQYLSVEPPPTLGIFQRLTFDEVQMERAKGLEETVWALQTLDMTSPVEMKRFTTERERYEFVTAQLKRAHQLGLRFPAGGTYAAVVLRKGEAAFQTKAGKEVLRAAKAGDRFVSDLLDRMLWSDR